ncbi:hypothetical protein [Haloplanus pelagicus]|uniref:hypothetical protein n=1 Tax=Haloplanus pelagicus TaxID=2949995 RepID=UPI002041AA36|nr:hypothetical protein [Haloplanus sp. HW8-1]
MTVDGVPVGSIGVYPGPNDPISTDYLGIDLSGWETGEYTVRVDGERAGFLKVFEDDTISPDWNEGDPSPPGAVETVPTTNDAPEIDPSDYAGIVNADNEQGIALAPALRREGASLGPQGATVELPDGRTVEVGAIQDADEAARYVDGPNQGEVIDADQPAAGSGSSGTDPTTSTGDLGPAVAVVALLGLGYAATQR